MIIGGILLVSLFQLGYCSNLVYENHAHPPSMKTPPMMRTITEDCIHPGSGCTSSHDVYWTGDCDGDGFRDHVCSTTINNNVWVVLSSNGCGDWKKTSAADCPAAFGGTTVGGATATATTEEGNTSDSTTVSGLFARIYSGDCNSNGLRMITNKQECEEAANILGLVDKYAYESQTNGKPYGCIYASNDWLAFASPLDHPYGNTPCGSHSVHVYDCLCAKTCTVNGATGDGTAQGTCFSGGICQSDGTCYQPVEYIILENSYCYNSIEEFDSLSAAKEACDRKSTCPMLFDYHGKGKSFKICEYPTDKRSTSTASVLYVKQGYYERKGACRNGNNQYEDIFSCVTLSTLEGCKNKCDAVFGCGAVSWNSYRCCGVSINVNQMHQSTTSETDWMCYYKFMP